MTLKQGQPPTPDQPSVSQFFKRKTPPVRSSSPPHAGTSSSTSAKRVKVEHGAPVRSAGTPPSKGKTRSEAIVLDSDDESDADKWAMDVDVSDDEVTMISGSGAAQSTPPISAAEGRSGSATRKSGLSTARQQSSASGSRIVPSYVASTGASAMSTAPVAPIFQRAQQAPPGRPSATAAVSKRPAFNAKDSAAAQALRILSYIEPGADLEETDPSGAGSSTVTQAPQSPEAAAAKAKRHEQFATKLLGRRFGRRRSLDLDEADARDGRGADDNPEASASSDADDQERIDDDSANGEGSASPQRDDTKLGVLKAKLTAPVKKTAMGSKKKAPPEVGPSGQTYTPLEDQVKSLKMANPGVLLIFEVGYKFRFFGEDAKTAAKILNIVAFPDRNFYTASIPVHRLFIHVRNLIANGYKVGVVRQIETAALKKISSNRSAPFTRKLTELYTASTWVDELASADDGAPGNSLVAVPPSNALVAIFETPHGSGKGKARETEDFDGQVKIGLVSVIPSTGDVTWDDFIDGPARTELETRITHIQPQEILLPLGKLSLASEKLLEQLLSPGSSSVRFERVPFDLDQEHCLSLVARFWRKKGADAVERMRTVIDFPDAVVASLAYAIRYLEDFNLASSLSHTATTFRRFSTHSHMLLNSNTLANLEVYRNADDGGEKGSLLWLLAATTTKMGKRQLREWVGRPLVDKGKLEERIEAVTEISSDTSNRVGNMKNLIKGLPDLPRGLVRIQSGRATPAELISVLKHFERISTFWEAAMTFNFASPLINAIIDSFSTLEDPLARYLEVIDEWNARQNDKPALWKDKAKYSEIEDARDMIMFCDHELAEELERIRTIIKRPKAVYSTIAGVENLIEIRISDAKKVPPRWIKVSSTKNAVRFHTPEVLRIAQEKEQHKETLAAEADKAFAAFLAEVSDSYDIFRTVANHLATLDCLMALAHTANMPGYTRPELTDEHQFICEGAFHPMVAALSNDVYVPNDVTMSAKYGRTKVITGPNMGGKSSMVRTVALIVLMAQIGSYVPASSVKLGVHDAIYTRMGTSDDILHGRSTFMVEISETSDVIRQATASSLVILDELGRGTSTYDGQALAEAVLHHLVTQVGCNTLFITHYPLVATSLARQFSDVSNWHMGFSQRPRPDGSHEITFLYRLAAGLAKASFGIECARLAGVPADVLTSAHAHSIELERKVEAKTAVIRTQRMADVLKVAFNGEQAPNLEHFARKARSLLAALL